MENTQNEQRIPGRSNKQSRQTDSGPGNTASGDRETISGTSNGTATNKVSFLFDPDYYTDWSGRRVNRFSFTDKAITLVILLLASLNLWHFIYHPHIDNIYFSNSPIAIFGFFTLFILCTMMGINSESPGKFKQLSITTFSMWLLSIVLVSGALIVLAPYINYGIDLYLFLPALFGLIAFSLAGIAGITYIFNTQRSILRLRRLSWGIALVGVIGVIQYFFGSFHIDTIFAKSMPLVPAIIFFSTGVFLNIVSKKVSALYKHPID